MPVDDHGKGRPPKVGHRKSRNGCIKCKTRRVKCDEKRPTCGNCSRLQMDCAWPSRNLEVGQAHSYASTAHSTRSRPTPSPNPPSRPSPSNTSGATSTTHNTPDQGAAAAFTNWPRWPCDDDPYASGQPDDSPIVLPESKARRLMEHRLMHNWHLTSASNSALNHPGSASAYRTLWATRIPELGLRYDNIQFGTLAASATRLLRSVADPDVLAARQDYFISSLRAQREEVANLCPENAEAVCFGALLITITSFAMLKERSLEPYQPPLEWLQLGRGAGTVLWQSVDAIVGEGREKNFPSLMSIAFSYPYFGRDQSYFDPSMRTRLSGVLTQSLPSGGDDWNDEETREAYEKALSYVGSIQHGIDDGEAFFATARRIQTFALLIPPRFIVLLGLHRPRALVIMAHFWATVSQVQGIWWLGEPDAIDPDTTALREIRAIRNVLPKEWAATMVWPLNQVGLEGP